MLVIRAPHSALSQLSTFHASLLYLSNFSFNALGRPHWRSSHRWHHTPTDLPLASWSNTSRCPAITPIPPGSWSNTFRCPAITPMLRKTFFFFDAHAGMPLLQPPLRSPVWVTRYVRGKPPPSLARTIMMTCPVVETKLATGSVAIGQSAVKLLQGRTT